MLPWMKNRTGERHSGSSHPRQQPRVVSPQYVFSVVTLAAFLVGMILVRPQPISLKVEGTLRHTRTSYDNVPLPELESVVDVRQALSDPDLLNRLWEQVTQKAEGLPVPVVVSNDGAPIESQQQAAAPPKDWSSQLDVQLHSTEGKPEETLITVTLVCAPKEHAVEFLDALMGEYQSKHQPSRSTQDISRRRDQITAARDFWKNRLQSSQKDLEEFIQDELRRREAAALAAEEAYQATLALTENNLQTPYNAEGLDDEGNSAKASAPASQQTSDAMELEPPLHPFAPPPALPVVEALNPEWNARAEQLQAAISRREELLRQVTQEHPFAVEATMAVQHLKAELASTPRTIPLSQPNELAGIPPEPGPSFNPPLAPHTARQTAEPKLGDPKTAQTPPQESTPEAKPKPPASFDKEIASKEIEQLATVKDLRGAIANAEQRLAQHSAELAELPQAPPSISEVVEIVTPAKVVEQIARMPSKARLSVVLLVACGLGTFAMQCCPKPQSFETYQRVEDVIDAVRLPLRGPLPTTDGPVIRQDLSVRWPKLSARFVHASEWTILATVALLVISISVDPKQSRTVATDPLRAILTTVHRITSSP